MAGVDEQSRARSPAEVQDAAVQPRGDDVRRPWSGHGYGHRVAAVRYRFCVAVDETALQSVASAKGESRIGNAWMNLVEGDWTPEDTAAQREETRTQYIQNGLDLEDWDDEVKIFPEIDGCIEGNVGWMKVCYQDLVPLLYSLLMDNNAFKELYLRPPGIRAWWLKKLLYYIRATTVRSVRRFTSEWNKKAMHSDCQRRSASISNTFVSKVRLISPHSTLPIPSRCSYVHFATIV